MPKAKEETSWVKLKPAEIEKKIVELAKQGMSAEKIGLELRDKHGIPKIRMYGKRMSQILLEAGIDKNSEHDNVKGKLDNLKKHMEKHKHDYSAKRSIMKQTGRINILKKAYQ